MTEPILIGTRGWNHPGWAGAFYPENLPADWRLSFYANNLRSVLVPAETWEQGAAADVRAWAEDVYAEFRFVLELPAALSTPAAGGSAALTDFYRTIELVRAQVAGVLLRVPAETAPAEPWLASLLRELVVAHPVCVDLPASWRTPAIRACLALRDAGCCWRVDTEAAPPAGGKLMLALASASAPRTQRRLLEGLAAWQGETGIAGLFFDHPEAAQQARLLAELMVV